MRSTLIALALIAAAPASAFAPSESVYQGIEPQRVHHTNAQVQTRLAQQPAWQAFTDEHPTWQARFDEVTGAPIRMWGGPIAVPTSSEEALADALFDLFDAHADLLNVEASALELTHIQYVERVDTWYVDFQAPRAGVDVYRGGLTARVKNGNLVMIGAMAYGTQPAVGSWDLQPGAALANAIVDGPHPTANHVEPRIDKRWLPVHDAKGLRLVATWMVRTRTYDVPGKWVSFVDARTGELLSVHNEVRFLDGTVTAWHPERTPDGSPYVQSPVPLAFVSDGVDTDITDDAGAFSLPGSEAFTDFNGDWLEVRNTDGADAELIRQDGNLEWTDADATQAEISTYVFLHQIREWGLSVAPEVGMVQGPVRSNVNLDDVCNAYFDGEVNFFQAGGGCNNTGEIADVNYHEWGHGFHATSISSYWYGFDGSLSEGAADVVSFLQTHDPIMAPYFFPDGNGIRDVAPNRVYPDDYVASQDYVHSNGLIFGGAMWDLWHALMDLEGEEAGTRSTELIFAGLLKGGPTIADAYDEAILADDDDGDLSNGTPHECTIIEAFGLHGLGPLGGNGATYRASHSPRKVHDALDKPYVVSVDLESSAPNCFDVAPTGGSIHYRTNGKGDWQTAPLSTAGLGVTGEIPVQEPGTFVEYWVDIEDASGADFQLPAGADINPFGFHFGPSLEVFCTDFENGKARFTHELVSGEEGDGADDWQHGAPAGVGGDPAAAFSGENVWGNDLGWDAFNGQYQDDKKNRLSSPEIDTLHYTETFLTFQRWLTIEDGVWDQARISADGEVVWSNVKGTPDVGGRNHLDLDWTPQAIDLKGAGDDGSVVVDWSLTSDGGLTFGGWTIDDVCILAPDTADNRYGINAFTAKRSDKGVSMSWMNPLHGPVDMVYVIRKDGGAPEGPTDGILIWTDDDVEVGAPNQFLDPDPPKWDTHYAVYAAGEAGVLSWTRDGFNYAFVEGNGPAPARALGEGAGCGCDAAPSPVGGLGLVGLIALGLRRRRD